MPPLLLIAYPVINPVLVNIPLPVFGPLPIRWYALAYIGGLVAGWAGARYLVARRTLWGTRQHPSVASIDDLVVYIAIGIIGGGRLGYILFYNLDDYIAHPLQMFVVWHGGMSFHGGLIGAALAMVAFARRYAVTLDSVTDTVAAVVPVGLFLGRIANFIKPELWGRPTDVPWAMKFPLPRLDGQPCVPEFCLYTEPRHPSQLYEAGLEGIALLVLLGIAIRLGGLRRDGLITALFCIGYAVARVTAEFFREPDKQLGYLFAGATMGMVLSVPVFVVGIVLLVRAMRRPRAADLEAADPGPEAAEVPA